MKTLNLRQSMVIGLLALCLPLVTACGASKSGGKSTSTDLASRDNPSNGSSNGGSNTKVYAECTPIKENNADIEGRLTTFYHPTSGAFYPEYIRLKFDRLPAEVTTTSTHYMQLFKWYIDASGKRKYATSSVGFYFQLKSNKKYLNSTPLNVISKATLQNIITDNGIGSSVTLTNFFDKVILVLEGMSLNYDAVAFALYDESKGTTAIASVDSLLPAFSANPNTYASEHSSSTLRELHPFWSYRNGNHTDEQYRNESLNHCIP